MPVLITAVALVGALCLLDLLLTFGVLRRLREHGTLLSETGQLGPPVIGLEAGQRPEPFSAVATSGRQVSNDSELVVVAFFSTSCSICQERVGPFSGYLAEQGIGPERVLAMVERDHRGEPPPYLAQLEEVATVCVEPATGPVARAFQVSGFPAFCLLDARGAVLAHGYDPAMLPEPARA
jgi:hypothetical protein